MDADLRAKHEELKLLYMQTQSMAFTATYTDTHVIAEYYNLSRRIRQLEYELEL